MFNKILGIVISLIVLAGAVVAHETRYTLKSEHQILCQQHQRINTELKVDKIGREIHYIQKRIWLIEDRNEGSQISESDRSELRNLKVRLERLKTSQDLLLRK